MTLELFKADRVWSMVSDLWLLEIGTKHQKLRPSFFAHCLGAEHRHASLSWQNCAFVPVG